MKSFYKIYNDDCISLLSKKKENTIDAIITDPPYGLGFMGKKWDRIGDEQLFHREWAKKVIRVAKPGAFMLSFGGTRTFHRMCCGIEDAGWEIRDCIMWVYGSGFPKSLNIGREIDKKLGNKREIVGHYLAPDGNFRNCENHSPNEEIRNPSTKYGHKTSGFRPIDYGNSEYEGMGTNLKPSYEPIILARKPIENTVVDNVLQYGTGGLSIDDCRIKFDNSIDSEKIKTRYKRKSKGIGTLKQVGHSEDLKFKDIDEDYFSHKGRFPANLIHDGSDEVVQLIGEAHRFFYCAKTSSHDREYGNTHPTVKPTDLMRYLVKLVTPKDGIILDPFMGSGSTGKAAMLENFKFIGIEKEKEYFEMASRRINNAFEKSQNRLFK